MKMSKDEKDLFGMIAAFMNHHHLDSVNVYFPVSIQEAKDHSLDVEMTEDD